MCSRLYLLLGLHIVRVALQPPSPPNPNLATTADSE